MGDSSNGPSGSIKVESAGTCAASRSSVVTNGGNKMPLTIEDSARMSFSSCERSIGAEGVGNVGVGGEERRSGVLPQNLIGTKKRFRDEKMKTTIFHVFLFY